MKTWNWNVTLFALSTLLAPWSAACGRDCESCGQGEPAAPQDLAAELYKSGIHLTWVDASDGEDRFIVERWIRSSATLHNEGLLGFSASAPPPSAAQTFGMHFIELVELPEDTVDYFDTDVDGGLTYVYRIRAANDEGTSLSDELEIAVP